jgi:site-specific DNA-cytosine methylase
MKVLELFSGTKSFSNVCRERGFEVFTIDINKKFKPDLCIDINELNYGGIKALEINRFDVIWASPPCEEYSHAKRTGVRDLIKADKNVLTALRIIKELKPKFWIIENPQTGLLKDREFMKGIPFTDVSYCKYGMPYRKQTRLWNNFGFVGKVCNKDCNFIKDKKHIGSAGNGRKKYTDKNYKLTDKYRVPRQLCEELLSKIGDNSEVEK